jgi:hypothetical protein
MTLDNLQTKAEFERSIARFEWLLIAVAAVFLAFGTFTSAIIDNDRSRLASVQSLVEQGTWVIDDSRFHQEPGSDYQIIDKVWINEHFYSSKPPVLSFLMAGAYWPLHHLLAYDFDREQDRRFLIWFLTFVFTGLPFLWIAILFRIAARWFIEDPFTRLVGLFIILFCNEHLGFAQTINNHVPAASLLFTAMILSIGIVHAKLPHTPIWFVLTGLAAGLLPTSDLPGSFFCVLLWLYLIWAYPSRTLAWFTLGAVPPLALHFGLTYLISGGVIPFYMVAEYYEWPGAYWGLKRAMDAAGDYETKEAYFFHLSVGRKGMFSLYPVLLLSMGYLFRIATAYTLTVTKKVLVGTFIFLILLASAITFLSREEYLSEHSNSPLLVYALCLFSALGFALYLRAIPDRFTFSLTQVLGTTILITLLVFGSIAWELQMDDRLSPLSTLFYYHLFAVSPVFAVWYIVRVTRDAASAERPVLAIETLGMGCLTLIWMLFYTFKSDNYGGSATGFRWFMFFTPALQFFGIFSIDRMKRGWPWALVCLIVAISFYSGYQAEVHPWSMNWDWPVRFLGKWITR